MLGAHDMAAGTISVAVNLPSGVETPHLSAALSDVVPALILFCWRDLAAGNVDNGDYIAALHKDLAAQYPFNGNPDAVSIVNVMPYAAFIEAGRVGFHLPSHWGNGGGKWKVGKKGLYATVPFRHRTPIRGTTGETSMARAMREPGGSTTGRRRQMMPTAIYKAASGLEAGQRLGGFGDLYKQSKSYNFFSQVFDNFPAELAGLEGYTWRASQYESLERHHMVTPAGGHHTEYMTFRTITPDSPGWYIPPTPAHRFGERALQMAEPQIRNALEEAAARDGLSALMGATEGVLE